MAVRYLNQSIRKYPNLRGYVERMVSDTLRNHQALAITPPVLRWRSDRRGFFFAL